MALNLDTRQRAMLQEMGITVWLPQALERVPTAPLRHSPAQVQEAVAVAAASTVPAATLSPPAPAAVARSAPKHAAVAPIAAVPDTQHAVTAAALDWRIAPAVPAYPQAAGSGAEEPAWLVVCESQNPAQPLAGEMGKLLDNMLRALRLHLRGKVWVASVQRPGSDALPVAGLPAAPVDWQPLQAGLTDCIQQTRPARMVVLGLHAARAVLGSQEALGRLRAQIHHVHHTPVVVSYDPAYLLRSPHAKLAAWTDLCRAHALQPPSAT